jgi:hypothetical protein
MNSLRLRDRLDDSQRTLPMSKAELVAGRWILEEAATYNSHTRLQAGDLVLDDGSFNLLLGDSDIVVQRPQLMDEERKDYEQAVNALGAIDAKTDLAAGRWPSPLLPSELGKQSAATNLESLLSEVFKKYYLDVIATQPKVSMRYDTELLAVDRARRLDSGFQRHLAAHSECWASRTLSGVIPKAVLARISNDDADIYEHRVYARLLDHLERYLEDRIRGLESINRRIAKALNFGNSESVDYRLREAICNVWGEAVSASDASNILDRNNDYLKNHLRPWLKRIRELKTKRVRSFETGSLYAAIPRDAQVGLNLMPTNLLQHDSHYRQLRLLWQVWLAATASERERPFQILERRQAEQACYERYIGLLLVRALRALKFEVKMADAERGEAGHMGWGEQMSISFFGHAWNLNMGERRLMLVPAAVALDSTITEQWTTRLLRDGKELRIPCVLQLGSDVDTLSPSVRLSDKAPALQLTPLDLYTEEVMIAFLSSWLWQQRVRDYGESFPRLPSAVIAAWPDAGTGNSSKRSLRKRLTEDQWKVLKSPLEQHIHDPELRNRITARKTQLDKLACCPGCNQPTEIFEPDDRNGFFARCNCGCEWRLSHDQFQVSRRNWSTPAFETLGRQWLDIPLT